MTEKTAGPVLSFGEIKTHAQWLGCELLPWEHGGTVVGYRLTVKGNTLRLSSLRSVLVVLKGVLSQVLGEAGGEA